MMNMMSMMKQAQNIQKRLKDAQEELKQTDITGEAGNGSVKIICDGKGIFKSIKLSPEAINPDSPSSVSEENIEMLEDLITAAINQATTQAQKGMEDKLKSITGGISIPGLF